MLDLVANFRPLHAVVLLPLGLLALLRNRRVAVGVIAIALLDVAVVVPYLVGGGSGIGDGDRLELMTFNVGVSNPNRDAVARFIADEDPDVVFVFESSFEWEDAFRRADLPLQIVADVPGGQIAGVTVLARPSRRPTGVSVGFGGEAAAITVDLGGERVDILGIHPPSPTDRARSARRDVMLADAAAWVRSRPGEVIVLGDLNATPWSHAFRRLRLGADLVDTLRASGLQPSWPEGWGVLAIPIDHVLHTDGLASADRRTGPALGSAHRPVLVGIGWAR